MGPVRTQNAVLELDALKTYTSLPTFFIGLIRSSEL